MLIASDSYDPNNQCLSDSSHYNSSITQNISNKIPSAHSRSHDELVDYLHLIHLLSQGLKHSMRSSNHKIT